MSVGIASVVFLAALALSVIASIVLARRLQQLGAWWGLSESLLGIVVALGADAPEISSAVAALHGGEHDLGLGIVLGSNIFNLAALLGLSAVLAGRIAVSRGSLLLNGGVALAVSLIVAAQLCRLIAGWWALALIAMIMVPYVTVVSVSPSRLMKWSRRLGLGYGLSQAIAKSDDEADRGDTVPRPSQADMLGTVPALVAIVVASIAIVRSASVLGSAWHVSGAILGTVVLASLTGIPNVVAATQLALRGRGSAVMSESLNSNTLNLIAGAAIPMTIVGTRPLAPVASLSLWWLIGMTVFALILAYVRAGLGRVAGVTLIMLYGAFFLIAFYP